MAAPLPASLFPPGVASVSVAEFMAAALYDPEHGYYTRQIRTVGRRGDFSTGPSISDAWGRAVARWALARRGNVRPWHLIEVGGGAGDLAFHVLKALGWWRRRNLHYHLVEISEPLRALQEKRLKGLPVRWHREIGEALAEARGEALIFSNELVDAFPCEQFVRRGDGWRQVRLSLASGGIEEIEGEAGALPSSSSLDPSLSEGQRVEVHASYRAWLADWLPGWKAGAMLTVDYGAAMPALYHRRPRGTLRGYAHHQTVEGADLYLYPGKRDLTADVNFGDLIAWGGELGLAHRPLRTQAEFLGEWVSDLSIRGQGDPAIAYLLEPEGMGGAFQVLEQTPGTTAAGPS